MSDEMVRAADRLSDLLEEAHGTTRDLAGWLQRDREAIAGLIRQRVDEEVERLAAAADRRLEAGVDAILAELRAKLLGT